MTLPRRPTPLSIPISSLLPPQSSSKPIETLPSPSAAVLGPLPPTSAIHLAFNWIALSDIPDYETSADSSCPHLTKGLGEYKAQALIITSSKDSLYRSLEEDDEDWLRSEGGGYAVLGRLKRIHIRYCPTPQHVLLLLSLLSSSKMQNDQGRKESEPHPQVFKDPPGLVILNDIAGMFMEDRGSDENLPPDTGTGTGEGVGVLVDLGYQGVKPREEPARTFKKNVTIRNYLDIISAAKAAVDHLSSSNPGLPPTQLIILEPHLNFSSSLPIIPPPISSAETSENDPRPISTPFRAKRIPIVDGLERILGSGTIGSISERKDIPLEATHVFKIPSSDSKLKWYLRKGRCPRGEWASAALSRGEDEQEDQDIPGDRGGWRWEWVV